ncbi:hypothetical protein KC678_02135 [Candidatus Dojkabacteria bacterium]|uniref:Uncharacterized protein n=1 Tax=Candidatus Dojkabacteria bacterium TaxID=2099670 RepID=A0A955ICJ8_9BACT|nr:hypothetical protein [Candidatus Dojkabacteria bacterium]
MDIYQILGDPKITRMFAIFSVDFPGCNKDITWDGIGAEKAYMGLGSLIVSIANNPININHLQTLFAWDKISPIYFAPDSLQILHMEIFAGFPDIDYILLAGIIDAIEQTARI